MHDLRSQLSNLDALIAFEAAARHSSFALAARELNITASAVSQQIKALEHSLGVALFNRGHRSVTVSEAGREFRNSVSVALLHLSNAATDIASPKRRPEVTIAADTSIVAHWLTPRLPLIKRAFPGIKLRLLSSDNRSELLAFDFDIAILHGRGLWTGYQSTLLFREEVFPVCSSNYREQLQGTGLAALESAQLLDLEYENWHWMNWTIWLTEAGIAKSTQSSPLRSNSYPTLIDAAKSGLGMALAWKHLHDHQLANGELVAPFDETVITENGYHLAWPYAEQENAVVADLRSWLTTHNTGIEWPENGG